MTQEASPNILSRTEAYRQRSTRRRDAARTVKNVRERLASHTGTKPAFDHEILCEYARNRLSSWPTMVLMLTALAVAASFWVDRFFIAAWLVLSMTMLGVSVLAGRRFLRVPNEMVRLTYWRRQFLTFEVLNGLAFVGLFFLPNAVSTDTRIFAFGVLLLAVAINAMVASNVPKAVLLSTVPVALGGAFQLMGERDFVGYAMAGFLLLAEGFFAFLAFRLCASALAMLEFRVEKDALIAELEQAKAVSDDSRRRAEEANLAKSKFLATMSHELRTPLNAILGFSEIMMGEVFGPVGNAHYKEYANDIHSSGQHLLNLINEILDLSRIEAGRYQLNEEAIMLSLVVEECHHLMKLKAKTKQITIVEQVEPDLPKLWADERAVRQIVLNLMSNAVKFTQIGGEIRIRIGWTAGGGQSVSVKDNGPGIPENEIPLVLQAFGQGSLAIQTAEQGTGLGLPICQALVQMHGGTMDLRSVLREGTEVTVTFPPTRVMEVMPAIQGDQPKKMRRAMMAMDEQRRAS